MSATPDPDADTVELVAGTLLQTLGRLGLSMIEAQRRVCPTIFSAVEKRFVTLCRAAAKCARPLVAARELVALARDGNLCQVELTRERHRPITAEYQAAVIAQRRWASAASEALKRQQESLPGMGDTGGGDAA